MTSPVPDLLLAVQDALGAEGYDDDDGLVSAVAARTTAAFLASSIDQGGSALMLRPSSISALIRDLGGAS